MFRLSLIQEAPPQPADLGTELLELSRAQGKVLDFDVPVLLDEGFGEEDWRPRLAPLHRGSLG